MCGITFEIYHKLYGKGKHREETCTCLRSDSMVCVKFPIRNGPAWELLPKLSHLRGGLCPAVGLVLRTVSGRAGGPTPLSPPSSSLLPSAPPLGRQRTRNPNNTVGNVYDEAAVEYVTCVGDAEYCNMSREEYTEMLNDYIYPKPYEWVLIATHSVVFVSVSVMVAVMTLTFISVDRWYAICFPLRFKSTTGRAKTAILVIWTISLIFNCPDLIVMTTMTKVPLRFNLQYLVQCASTWSEKNDLVWYIVKAVFVYLIPLLLITVAYHQIAHVLWHSKTIPGRAETVKLTPSEQSKYSSDSARAVALKDHIRPC
ncbi:hypothetical protein MSG28_013829 [Choristoneura fumiferana]|uniref:Uncharacterized protein n=1 Tax=Choristoneura fumiferana TaxID=7141 RepID=A0ACC0K8Y3_CHOFU|nr:hypothetical protein MSG28_013829 [Choristoneura fumiferana]